MVFDAFTGGGPPMTLSFTNQDRMEFANTTTVTHGVHLLRWGGRLRGVYLKDQDTQNYTGTFTFSSLDSYRLTLLGQHGGLTPQQIRAAGGGASQFSLAAGDPLAGLNQFDARICSCSTTGARRPNLTLSLGFATKPDPPGRSSRPRAPDWFRMGSGPQGQGTEDRGSRRRGTLLRPRQRKPFARRPAPRRHPPAAVCH